ncbi:ABC transporter ATP-binding protein [Collinsella ihumii]|uniref:ABC transporter ATP-binding protein n=1 Tax=Collinsella ihumii TaxID=1720204 RepID=A0ABT7XED3_9ACTN|nr:ABC transporter ATP-binding protein [Collinsella ihumii]MDN0063764.1 ABC transporter ATP-binding protein [Collinsella ihumii]
MGQNGESAAQGKGRGAISQLLDFAEERRVLTYVGCLLSAASMLISFGPYICIWLVARDLIAVAPDWSAATGIGVYGWWALVFAVGSILLYFAGLMCTHAAAFRCASNMRKRATEHLMHTSLGYFDTHASGALRRVVDGCAAETEGLLAHKLPNTAGSIAMIVGMLVLFFVFDWRLGLACLAAVAISLACLFYMMGGRGMDFMTRYMESLVKMNKTGTEYVRGIPVVKVFQQTVYSFRAFHDAIEEFTRLAQDYAVTWCQVPQSLSLAIINGVVVFLVPVALLLAPGATVALVGPSGGGKTTAASLVPRFWDVDSGRVSLGGVDVRDLDPHGLMDRVAFVFQANRLFRQTVLENVRASRPEASREEVLAALSAAQCDDILEKLPQGVDTLVGTGGTYLSGGEVQRLMIARAILKDAPVVVLDEATAFADPENEVKIQKAFKRLARSRDGAPRTVIMIAHRLSTVRGADNIVVLDRGRVAEQGSHGQLLAAGGIYARMWADYEQAVSWRISSDAASTERGDAR